MSHGANLYHRRSEADRSSGSSTGTSDTRPLLNYEDNHFEISPEEYIPPKPYYLEDNYNFFHPEHTASSLVAHKTHNPHHRHHHHHQLHHQFRRSHSESRLDDEARTRLDTKKLQEIDDVLDMFLFPRDFKDKKGNCFRQNVSALKATPESVKALAVEVEKRLTERHAREGQYCPIRRSIFSDCFDELLRQVILEDPGTGVLLGRIRDEIRMTLGCYRRLNQSMETYSSRKSFQLDAITKQLADVTTEPEPDQYSSLRELIDLRAKYAQIVEDFKEKEAQWANEYEAGVEKRQEELEFFKEISNQLNQKMEQVRANAKQFL